MPIRRIAIIWLLAYLIPQSLLAAAEGQLISDTVHSRALEGNLQGNSADRSVLVYLPPSYSSAPTKRYPVLYLLHGNGGTGNDWVNGSYQGLNIQAEMDALVATGSIHEMIVVMPDASTQNSVGSHYANSTFTGGWADFISQELVAYIDVTYRTIPSPDSRGLAGHSMGGRGTLYLATQYPGVYSSIYGLSSGRMAFDQFEPFTSDIWLQLLALENNQNPESKFIAPISFSAAFSPNLDSKPFPVDFPFEIVDGELKRVEPVWQKWLDHDPVALVSTHKENLMALKAIQFDCGTSDELIGANRLFSQALTAAGIPHRFEEYDGNHGNRIKERLLTRVLPFFSEALVIE